MSTITTTTTTTLAPDAEIRINILSNRCHDIDFDTFCKIADAKIIRTNGDAEVWKVTFMDGKSAKVKAVVSDFDMDF